MCIVENRNCLHPALLRTKYNIIYTLYNTLASSYSHRCIYEYRSICKFNITLFDECLRVRINRQKNLFTSNVSVICARIFYTIYYIYIHRGNIQFHFPVHIYIYISSYGVRGNDYTVIYYVIRRIL